MGLALSVNCLRDTGQRVAVADMVRLLWLRTRTQNDTATCRVGIRRMRGEGDCSCSKCRFFAAGDILTAKTRKSRKRSKFSHFWVITPQEQLSCGERKNLRIEKLSRLVARGCDVLGTEYGRGALGPDTGIGAKATK